MSCASNRKLAGVKVHVLCKTHAHTHTHSQWVSHTPPAVLQSLPDAVTFFQTIHFTSTSEGTMPMVAFEGDKCAYVCISEWWGYASGSAWRGHIWDQIELRLIHSLAWGHKAWKSETSFLTPFRLSPRGRIVYFSAELHDFRPCAALQCRKKYAIILCMKKK